MHAHTGLCSLAENALFSSFQDLLTYLLVLQQTAYQHLCIAPNLYPYEDLSRLILILKAAWIALDQLSRVLVLTFTLSHTLTHTHSHSLSLTHTR